MFNHLESLGTQETPSKSIFCTWTPQTRTADAAAGKTTAGTAVGGIATRKKSRRNFKAGLTLWKHRLSMAC